MLERQREGIAQAKAENRYMGRRPSARLKADEAVKLFKAGRSVTDIAMALNIGRGSVYRALEAAGMKSASGWSRPGYLASTHSHRPSKKTRGGAQVEKSLRPK